MPENHHSPGWYRDPTGAGEGRYWDGTTWTSAVSLADQTFDVPIEPERASLPPIPGSELRPPAPAAAPPSVTVNAPSRSPIGAIIGGILAIVVVVVVIVFLTNDDSSNDESPPPTNAPATEAPAETPAPEG